MEINEYANDWFKSQEMGWGVTRIWEAKIRPEFRANIWHVRGRDRDLLVDSGFGLMSLVQHIPLLSEKPILAVATHSHCDHIGGHYEFSECAIHHAEADILRRPTRQNTVALGYVSRTMFEQDCPADFDPDAFDIRGQEHAFLLSDSDRIDLGDRVFEVIHVPGHSPGSIALLETATGILFSGDVVHNGRTGIGRFLLYHSNLDDWLSSVERLRRVSVEIVHAGHFESFGRTRFLEILDEYLERRRTPGFPLELRSYT